MATSTNYGWSEPDNTSLVRDGAQAIRTLGDAIDTSLWNSGYGQAGKNKIINGGMQIWQRGTTISLGASTSAANGFLADRWQTSTSSGQASTITRQVTGDTTNLPFIQYCLRYQRNSGQTGTALSGFYQSIETVNAIPFVGKTITVSFYARSGADFSPTSDAIAARVYSGTGTDQSVFSYTGSASVINATKNLTATWQRFTVTSAAPVATTVTELAVGFEWTPTGTAGAADYFEVTGVQIEVGSTATPFQTASGGSIQNELAMCQRYYQKSYDTGTTPPTNTTLAGIVFAASGNVAAAGGIAMVTLKSEMRVAPTVTVYSYTTSQTARVSDNSGTDLAASSGFAQYIGTRSFQVANNSGGTINAAFNGFIFHYVASAEL